MLLACFCLNEITVSNVDISLTCQFHNHDEEKTICLVTDGKIVDSVTGH